MAQETSKFHILVSAAVPEEAAGIKEQLASMKHIDIGGRPVFEGTVEAVSVRLMETGPGMVNAAQSLTAAIEAGPTDMILMTGCAGVFARAGMNVGDIGIAAEENDAHLGIEPEVEGEPPAPLPFDLEVVGGVPVSRRMPIDPLLTADAVAVLKDGFEDASVNIVSGPFVTVSTITATDRGADRLYEWFHPCMENMEGAAGAHVARHYCIPFLEIRCASNLVGNRNRGVWDLPLACRRSADAAVMWIRAYGRKKRQRSADYAD